MNEPGRWMRRSGCVGVLLATLGLYGCGLDSAREGAPTGDIFRHAHVLGSASPSAKGWTPMDYWQAYNVVHDSSDAQRFRGTKTAVIVAYHNSHLQNDLNTFCKKFSIKAPTLTIINQAGNVTNAEWALEGSADVAMVVTANPWTTLYVIEAKSDSRNDLLTAIETAVNLGAEVITMSFGVDEFSEEGAYAHLFLNASVTWVAASGDSSTPSFPATLPDVIAVGGTTLSSVAPFTETTWTNAGAGISLYQVKPSFQKIAPVLELNATTFRSLPDVAFNADPFFGMQVYSSIYGGWVVVGGTSIAAPFFAGVVSMANASRKRLQKPLFTSVANSPLSLQKSLYALLPTSGGPTILHDVVQGSSGDERYLAGPGYDIATGLGSLNVSELIDYLDSR